MRIGLADIKKRISRANDELVVTPHLLGPRQLARELEALVALYEAYLGRDRAGFPADRPAEIVGDYRLARCLTLVLDEWYAWQPVAWPGGADAREVAALAAHGMASPSDLRLALYDRVNDAAGGYLPTSAREGELDDFARDLGVERRTFDNLLRLDADECALLARLVAEPPTARELAARYNQQVFEALLANASQVEWFVSAEAASAAGTSIGALVKRICFLARRLGVQYEVGFAAPDESAADMPDEPSQVDSLPLVAERRAAYATVSAPVSLDAGPHAARRSAVYVTLYGPLEVTGSPQQYGERLARLCRALLGYRRASDDPGRAVFSGLASTGSARVYVRGRPMLLRLDERLLKLVSSTSSRSSGAGGQAQLHAPPVYDSAVEGRLAAEFAALEAAGESHEWRLEREPEPVVVGDTILVPDFTVSRGARRVYLEIAGYWRPEYRERKTRKLLAARHAVDLAVAAPHTAREAFAPLEPVLPVLWYGDAPRASALLDLLGASYDDFAERLARVDLSHVRLEVSSRGRIPPMESTALLHCYSRAELARALDKWSAASDSGPGGPPPDWVDDVGLCDRAWVEGAVGVLQSLVAQADDGRLPLATLADALSDRMDIRPVLSESAAEALARRAHLRVARSSLFAAEVLAADGPDSADGSSNPHTERSRQVSAQPRRSRSRSQHQSAAAPQSLFPLD